MRKWKKSGEKKSGKKFRIKSGKKSRKDQYFGSKIQNSWWISIAQGLKSKLNSCTTKGKKSLFFSNYSVVYNFLCMIVHEIWGGWDRPLKVEVPIRLWQLDANVDDL